MSKKTRIALIAVIVVVLLGLALPVSNLIIGRDYVQSKTDDAAFQQVSQMLQDNCADCHTPDLTVRPIYFSVPIASSIIKADMKLALTHMEITRDQLTGEVPLNAVQLAKIEKVLVDGSMPPTRYRAMHWNTGAGAAEAKLVADWVESIPGGIGPQPIPLENPFNPDPAKAALGEQLYFDTMLSGDGTLSCASCHDLGKGGCDVAPVATGIDGQLGPINSPTVFNAAFNMAQFWDGRAADLQEQAAGPVANPIEMGAKWEDVVERVAADEGYAAKFKELYGGEVTIDTITNAIALYEMTLLTPNSRFDKYLRGDKEALSEQEQRGYELFVANDCATCHAGVNLGGLTYERMGLKGDYFAARGTDLTDADVGRMSVTKEETDRAKFKTPTLRNVALTGPYFHDASAKTLEDAVKTMAEFQSGVKLSEEEVAAVVAFLETLTGEYKGQLLTAP